MEKNSAKSNIALLSAAAIWGLAFVAQSDGMNYIGPFAFTCVRCFIGVFALIPVCAVNLRAYAKTHTKKELKLCVKRSCILGAVCGTILFGATITQQIGIQYTSAGKSGFITALYIVLVPVFGRIIFKNKTSPAAWVSVIIAAAGLYLLCFKEDFSIGRGDIWVISCAFLFTFQILALDRFSEGTNSVLISLVQFFMVSAISFPFMLIIESMPTYTQLRGAGITILYTGIFSSAVAYTLQIVGQKSAKNPTVAALLMSMESVFAAISGAIILHERFSLREMGGVVLMLGAVILSQFSSNEKGKVKTANDK